MICKSLFAGLHIIFLHGDCSFFHFKGGQGYLVQASVHNDVFLDSDLTCCFFIFFCDVLFIDQSVIFLSSLFALQTAHVFLLQGDNKRKTNK